jgi:hypothetical protein
MNKILFALAIALSFGAHGQQSKFDAVTITTHKVADNVYMLEGPGRQRRRLGRGRRCAAD